MMRENQDHFYAYKYTIWMYEKSSSLYDIFARGIKGPQPGVNAMASLPRGGSLPKYANVP
jgi:hypothetical protein